MSANLILTASRFMSGRGFTRTERDNKDDPAAAPAFFKGTRLQQCHNSRKLTRSLAPASLIRRAIAGFLKNSPFEAARLQPRRVCWFPKGPQLQSLRKIQPPQRPQLTANPTQRRPGSPHSKKQTPLRPQYQHDAIPGSSQSTAEHHFEKGAVSTSSIPDFPQAVQPRHTPPTRTKASTPPANFAANAIRKIALLCMPLFLLPQPAIPQAPAGSPPASEQTPTFHVKVRLVNVFVNVTDPFGYPIGGLTQDDFTLTEDGVPQKISYFERQTDMPLSLVLAIDTSGSVRKDLDIEVHAARDFLHALLRPNDRLDLIDFNSSVREVVPFTADLHRLDSGLDNLDFGPATALYDAIYLSSQNLASRSGRKVLVLVSDGGNTVKGTDYTQALDQAIRDEVMVYSLIDLPILNDAGRDTGGEHALITLSQETGGKYYYAEFGDISKAFRKISEDLRTQYLIGYYPAQRRSQTDFRRIQVTLKSTANRGFTLRYRPGYYAPPSLPLDQ